MRLKMPELRTIVQHFALPAGLELKGRIVVENSIDRDIELLDYALAELSLKPVLGAQSARGCGEISGHFEFFDAEGRITRKVTLGDFKPLRTMTFS
jgi:hypothetical protein